MESLRNYIQEVLGFNIVPRPLSKPETDRLPFYITESFRLSGVEFLRQQTIIAECLPGYQFTSLQSEKMVDQVKNITGNKVILVPGQLSSIERKRLIRRAVNFIVPGTQLYLPDFLVDLRENFKPWKEKKEKLVPSAQMLLLYKILHDESLEEQPFKELAATLGYTPMGISKSVENLIQLNLCTSEGTKEKFIRFNKKNPELWQMALPFLSSPVLKKIFVDNLPTGAHFLKANVSALPEYSDLAEGRQQYRAIEKDLFYAILKKGGWKNLNESEGEYCIEVWKYDPVRLAGDISREGNVDPLSLYLSLGDNKDERIESAREQIIETFIY